MSKDRNLVAKHARTFNKATVHRDKKKSAKRGYEKHKNKNPRPVDEVIKTAREKYIEAKKAGTVPVSLTAEEAQRRAATSPFCLS